MRKPRRQIRVKSPSMGKLDHADLALLSALADDPRATVVALAERLRLSRNTVQARMTKLEKAGVFLSYERTIAPSVVANGTKKVPRAYSPRSSNGPATPSGTCTAPMTACCRTS